MIADTLTPAARVLLDRRITEERMIALDPPFRRPDWLYAIHGLSHVPNAFVMGADGAVSRQWEPADEVDWTRAVAVRFETSYGASVSIAAFDFDIDEDDDDDCVDEEGN